MSFGFKHGMPIDADLVFDVRFLKTHIMWRSYVQNGSSNRGIFLCFSFGRHANPHTKTNGFIRLYDSSLSTRGQITACYCFWLYWGQHRSVTLAEFLGHILRARKIRLLRIVILIVERNE